MSNNPYESPRVGSDAATSASNSSSAKSIAVVVIGIVLGVFLIAMLLPTRRGSREAARRNQCISQVKQIAIALHAYEDAYGSLPPAYTVDANGNRLHSWRTLLLPFMGKSELYESVDLTKPWDDPANSAARDDAMYDYTCPSASHDDGLTTYFAVVGPDTALAPLDPHELSGITDGLENTIVVIDADSDRAVHWMSPYDLSLEEAAECITASSGQHPGIFNVAYADGHASAVNSDIEVDRLRALLTIAGGEEIEW